MPRFVLHGRSQLGTTDHPCGNSWWFGSKLPSVVSPPLVMIGLWPWPSTLGRCSQLARPSWHVTKLTLCYNPDPLPTSGGVIQNVSGPFVTCLCVSGRLWYSVFTTALHPSHVPFGLWSPTSCVGCVHNPASSVRSLSCVFATVGAIRPGVPGPVPGARHIITTNYLPTTVCPGRVLIGWQPRCHIGWAGTALARPHDESDVCSKLESVRSCPPCVLFMVYLKKYGPSHGAHF